MLPMFPVNSVTYVPGCSNCYLSSRLLNSNQLSGLQRPQGCRNQRNQGPQVVDIVARRHHDHDADSEVRSDSAETGRLGRRSTGHRRAHRLPKVKRRSGGLPTQPPVRSGPHDRIVPASDASGHIHRAAGASATTCFMCSRTPTAKVFEELDQRAVVFKVIQHRAYGHTCTHEHRRAA